MAALPARLLCDPLFPGRTKSAPNPNVCLDGGRTERRVALAADATYTVQAAKFNPHPQVRIPVKTIGCSG